MGTFDIRHGDCLDILRTLPDNSVDAVVTDPPYGLSFMGKKWDYDVPATEVWAECLRVLKPGGHLLAFAGTRTQHRMCVRIEDAGFEIRDMIAWVYGQGFPKSLDVSKAIDKAAGAERKVVGFKKAGMGSGKTFGMLQSEGQNSKAPATVPATVPAQQWSGWGTALKPAMEPITVARKPLDGTVAANVQEWGTGAINVDGCRVGTDGGTRMVGGPNLLNKVYGRGMGGGDTEDCGGRWPANLIHDGSEEVVRGFPQAGGGFGTQGKPGQSVKQSKCGDGRFGFVSNGKEIGYGDSGSAARFFYCAKASKADREDGLDGFVVNTKRILNGGIPSAVNSDPVGMSGGGDRKARNNHPTVKPTALMQYLCRLVTPPGGTVLDPFTGSGSTGRGAILEGFNFIGIERESEYVEIARARIQNAADKGAELLAHAS